VASPTGPAIDAAGIEVPSLFKDIGTYVVDGLIGGVTNGWSSLRQAFTSLANQICTWFKDLLGINSPSRVFAGFGGNIVEGIIGGIGGMLGALKDKVVGLAEDIAGWMKDAIGSAWQSGKDIAAGIGNGVKEGAKATVDAVKNGAGTAWQAGKDTARGLGEGIRNGAGSVWAKAKELATGTENATREELDTHSPSRVFRRIGLDITGGLNKGLDAQRDEPARRIRDIAKRVATAGAGMAIGTAAVASPTGPAIDAAGSLQIDRRPAMSAAPAGGSSGLTVTGGINIEVNATPGMDEQALARYVAQEVQRALRDAEQRSQARRLSSMRDID
jgi:phage-related protein